MDITMMTNSGASSISLPRQFGNTKGLRRNDSYFLVDLFLKDLDGREKLMKIAQYFLKVIFLYRPRHSLANLVTQLSLTRQVLCLGTVVNDLRILCKHPTNILVINCVVNALADDIYCLCRIIQPKNKRWQHYSAQVSTYCWFLSILVNLKKQVKYWKKNWIAKLTLLKLFADLIFCGCDIFHPACHGQLQAWSGLTSGLLAAYKTLLL
ncbi:MAG: hypothetical protein EXX96DRAFT_5362 [Benjaminiella poitrasii]|nr:MAG: hypothetical protein EXX96DRAFT_5362 [Benjaminiella poitrasii]